MKLIFTVLFSLSFFYQTAVAADEPASFEKFFKKTMKVTPGLFTVYQDGSKYFMEIPESIMSSDILVIGDIARGFSSNVSQSSGVIRFSVGTGNNLNVTRQVYKEVVSPDFNQGMEGLVQKSNLIPVSFVMHIEATGKAKKSYIIDITRQLMEGGDLFSFKDFSGLSRTDAARSGVEQVKSYANGVLFSVLRTQTDPGNSMNGIKFPDKAVAYVLNLLIQRLPASNVKVREADPRIGFGTVAYNDFGKNPYGVRNVKVITRWDLQVSAADKKRYAAGELVNPVNPIKVYLDPAIPSLFVPYIKQAVEQWNGAFNAAGFKNAIQVVTGETDNWLSSGKMLIKWGNAFNGIIPTNLVTDPRTGEIIAAKMNIGDDIINDLLPSYFAKCGLIDLRVQKDLYDPAVRGEIMRWKVAQTMGELLGMIPNLHGSAAYTNSQIRSAAWLKKNSFSSSVTDDTQFNFVVQPGDNVPLEGLIPRVSVYDRMAIGWAYRIFADAQAEKKALSSIDYSNASLLFLEENKNDAYASRGDLSSNQLEAAELGMKNLQLFYPQMEKITSAMKGGDEDWANFKLLSSACQKSYQLYTNNILGLIGSQSLRPVLKNYNDIAVVYTPKKDQQKAMAMFNTYFFNGPPAWMQSKRLNLINTESEDIKMQHATQDALKKLITPAVLGNLIKAEEALGKDTYTVTDLFNDLDHYVFKDFDTVNKVDSYTMLMQTNFAFDVADAALKNNITGGLSDTSEVMHLYFTRTMAHIKELAEKHSDPLVREHYQLIKVKIERDINQKPN